MYKIKIWKNKIQIDEKEHTDLNVAKEWFMQKYKEEYEMGECGFDVYQDNKMLDIEQCYKLGFFD